MRKVGSALRRSTGAGDGKEEVTGAGRIAPLQNRQRIRLWRNNRPFLQPWLDRLFRHRRIGLKIEIAPPGDRLFRQRRTGFSFENPR